MGLPAAAQHRPEAPRQQSSRRTGQDLQPFPEGPNMAQQPQEGAPQGKASVLFSTPTTGQMAQCPRDSKGTGCGDGGTGSGQVGRGS